MPDSTDHFSKKSTTAHVGDGETMDILATGGSREAFVEAAVRQYQSPLIGYATTLLHDSDLARDVVQDTFIRLCNQKPDKVAANLKTWLFTVCRNRAFDILRKNKRVEPIDELRWKQTAGPDRPPDRDAIDRERIEHVMRHLDRLPENQRDCILLKFQQGLSYREIHQITGLNEGNIGFLIHTGLKRLRSLLPTDLMHD